MEHPLHPVKKFSEIADRIQPLDFMLFRGMDWISKTISNIEESTVGNGEFTHIEIVVNSDILPTIAGLVPGKWYIIGSESTLNAPPGERDFEGKVHFGVQIRDLEAVIASYEQTPGAYVCWCKNIDNLYTKNPTLARERMVKLHREYGEHGYEWNIVNLLSCSYDWLRAPRAVGQYMLYSGLWVLSWVGLAQPYSMADVRLYRLFCSKLAALIAKTMDNIPPDTEEGDISPMDFLYPRYFTRFLEDPVVLTPSE